MFFDKTVTVFRSTEEGVVKAVISGVFLDNVKGISLENKGEAEANSIKVVIPASNMPEGFEVEEGDYICKGNIETDYESISSMRKNEECFLVKSCDKKDFGSAPNYLILGR